MDEIRGDEDNISVKDGDVVRLRGSLVFKELSDSRNELTKKAGTTCVVVDVLCKDGVLEGVVVEDYDPIRNQSWLASVGIDEVECVWRVPQ